jgi:large subunit ribosomal protein L21
MTIGLSYNGQDTLKIIITVILHVKLVINLEKQKAFGILAIKIRKTKVNADPPKILKVKVCISANLFYFCTPILINYSNKQIMYAIVDIAGQQFKVEKDNKIYVHRLEGEEGSEFELGRVLLVDNDGEVVIGTPNIQNAVVKARILSHLKGDKVLVFKKKRRKGYQKLNGHRQYLTRILIEDIVI